MKKLQILGTGCPKCKKLAENAEAAAKSLGIQYVINKVTDLNQIMSFGVMMTPALVVDVARSGGDSPLLTQMLAGLNLGNGTIGQATTGAAALRNSTVFNQNLINGNLLAVANSLLSGTSTTWTGFMSKTIAGQTPAGRLVRGFDLKPAEAGRRTVPWNGRNAAGDPVPPHSAAIKNADECAEAERGFEGLIFLGFS